LIRDDKSSLITSETSSEVNQTYKFYKTKIGNTMFSKSKVNTKQTKNVLDNMLKIKKEEVKKSRSEFFDNVVQNKRPSYEKNFSFLSPTSKSHSRSFKTITEQQDLDFYTELEEILEELDRE